MSTTTLSFGKPAPTAPAAAPTAYVIWWLSQDDYSAIGWLHSDADIANFRKDPRINIAEMLRWSDVDWPVYVKDTFARGHGRVGRGELLVPDGCPVTSVKPNKDSPFYRAASHCYGIPVLGSDAWMLAGWPGFLTDLDLMPWVPSPPSAVQEKTVSPASQPVVDSGSAAGTGELETSDNWLHKAIVDALAKRIIARHVEKDLVETLINDAAKSLTDTGLKLEDAYSDVHARLYGVLATEEGRKAAVEAALKEEEQKEAEEREKAAAAERKRKRDESLTMRDITALCFGGVAMLMAALVSWFSIQNFSDAVPPIFLLVFVLITIGSAFWIVVKVLMQRSAR
jgi:hypothetical protein